MERFRRRHAYTVFGQTLWMPSPEDVILKLLWYKEAQTDKHLNDAPSVWAIQSRSI